MVLWIYYPPLQVEVETSEFYKRMVAKMDAQGRAFFARFLQIEEGHVTLVQSEIDVLQGTGFWVDLPEFKRETG